MAMDISGLSSMYTDYLNETAKNETASKLQQNIKTDYSNATDEELMSACKQFESYFLEQVFKEMQKTIPQSDYSDSSTATMVDYVKGNMVQEIASDATKNGELGLTQMLYQQMKRNYDV